METPPPDLAALVLAMAHWLEAAQDQPANLARSSHALAEARRRLDEHWRLSRSDTASDARYSAPPREA
jgi:hypothetical protein